MVNAGWTSATLLPGIEPFITCKVSMVDGDGLVSLLAAARSESLIALQERDDVQKAYSAVFKSRSIIRELQDEADKWKGKFHTCQRDMYRREMEATKREAELEQLHKGSLELMLAMQANRQQLKTQFKEAQQLLLQKDAEIKRLKQEAKLPNLVFDEHLPSAAEPPCLECLRLKNQVLELTQQVKQQQQLLSELQDELALKDLEVAAMSGATWGCNASKSTDLAAVKNTADAAAQTDLKILCDTLTSSVDTSTEEHKLQAVNCDLKKRLHDSQQEFCHRELELATLEANNQQLQEENTKLKQQVAEMNAKFVELNKVFKVVDNKIKNANSNSSMAAEVQSQKAELQRQVAELLHCKPHPAAELSMSHSCWLQHQQQRLTEILDALKGAQPALARGVKQCQDQAADVHPQTTTSPSLSAACVSNSSGNSSLLQGQGKFAAGSSGSRSTGTPEAPVLPECPSFSCWQQQQQQQLQQPCWWDSKCLSMT